MASNEIYARRSIKLGAGCYLVDLGGGVALIQCDYVAATTAYSFTRIGTLPDGYVLRRLEPDTSGTFVAPMSYRGRMNANSLLEARPDGSVNVYTPTTDKYYCGQLTILYDRDDA